MDRLEKKMDRLEKKIFSKENMQALESFCENAKAVNQMYRKSNALKKLPTTLKKENWQN